MIMTPEERALRGRASRLGYKPCKLPGGYNLINRGGYGIIVLGLVGLPEVQQYLNDALPRSRARGDQP